MLSPFFKGEGGRRKEAKLMKRTVKLDLLIYNAGKLTYFQDMLVLIVN